MGKKKGGITINTYSVGVGGREEGCATQRIQVVILQHHMSTDSDCEWVCWGNLVKRGA